MLLGSDVGRSDVLDGITRFRCIAQFCVDWYFQVPLYYSVLCWMVFPGSAVLLSVVLGGIPSISCIPQRLDR